ncbi:hypothetical protein F4810DRAFT_55962 [Camillea tinctor]|nr:hypothetical protein F4810DRAFT_55962 [Camillea tinctor]
MGSEPYHVRYNRHMMRYGLGHALFEPQSSHDLKPGSCGYLDHNGTWRQLLDLTDKHAVEDAGYLSVDGANPASARITQYSWGPKHTDTVSYTKLDIKAGVSGISLGIPAEASVLIDFKLEKDFGAVLLCAEKVEKSSFHHLNPFRRWAFSNAVKVLQEFPDVEKYGFHIVTTTYSTTDVYINAWGSKANSVALGFQAGMTPAGEIAPVAESYRASSASNWNHPICKDDEKMVVFFSGLLFKYNKLLGWFRKDKIREVPYRGGEGDSRLIIRDPRVDEDAYEVVVSSTGLLLE